MSKKVIKKQSEILRKLKIEKLNAMQEEAHLAIQSFKDTVILSPTGTGKTLAFLLPIIDSLNPDLEEIQALVICPTRELAIQIEQVTREMGSGYKTNAFYGGRNFSKDKIDLNHPPAILVGTPGRISDHFRRGTFSTSKLKTLVLDEFDKSLEMGFEDEMKDILNYLRLDKTILTSATQGVRIPAFTGIKNPHKINYLSDKKPNTLEIKTVSSPSKDKLEALGDLIFQLDNQSGIVFCNFKDSIDRVSDYLDHQNIPHGVFYGGLEQQDRERALIKFRNGTYNILLATDLAARGIDVPALDFIIHYHLPFKEEEFIHRNGRTARMQNHGTAFIIHWEKESLPSFISKLNPENFSIKHDNHPIKESVVKDWTTLFVSGGRKDKISKGDIVGLFFKQGGLEKDELGTIELKQDCAFVAVDSAKATHIISKLNNSKLKKKKVRIREV